jgi:broad specificity phosphatase PhoE
MGEHASRAQGSETGLQAPTVLVLVRHAEAVCRTRRVVGGARSDTGLTENGRRQAKALRDRLQLTGELTDASCLVTSLLPRALETAEMIAPAVGPGGLAPTLESALCELDPGEADGLTMPEYESRFGRPDWEKDPSLPFAPGGDSLVSFFERATEGLRRLVEAHAGETVVAVTHGAVIEASLARFLGLRFSKDGIGLSPEWCSMTWWAYDRAGQSRWRLDRFSDAEHLVRQRSRRSRRAHVDSMRGREQHSTVI